MPVAALAQSNVDATNAQDVAQPMVVPADTLCADTLQADTTCLSGTVFALNNQRIAVSQKDGKTVVAVYDGEGNQLKKVSETQFVDGQEVERFYLTSPFVPQTLSSHQSKQYSHYPFLYLGISTLADSRLGFSGGWLIDEGSSREWGITGVSFAFPLNHSLAITSSLAVGRVSHHFDKGYALYTTDGSTALQPFEGEKPDQRLKASYLSYWVTRFPIMLEWSRRYGRNDAYLAIGPSIEFRFDARSRYKLGKHRHTLTDQTNINPIGLNIDARVGYSYIMLYARVAVTPLLKHIYAPEWFPFSMGVGFRF